MQWQCIYVHTYMCEHLLVLVCSIGIENGGYVCFSLKNINILNNSLVYLGAWAALLYQLTSSNRKSFMLMWFSKVQTRILLNETRRRKIAVFFNSTNITKRSKSKCCNQEREYSNFRIARSSPFHNFIAKIWAEKV